MPNDADNEAFRNAFRAGVPADYSGIRHGVAILGFGVAVIALSLLAMRQPLQLSELAFALPVLLLWNLLEWYGHRALHRPGQGKLSRALYTRHTLTHHRFFTLQCATLRDARDLKIVFFPSFALPLLTLMALPAVGLLFLLAGRNAALVALISWVGIYLVFEFMHLCAHLPEGQWLTRVPGIAAMRRHHQLHHDPRRMMDTNLNFTFPFADWLKRSLSQPVPGDSRDSLWP